MRIFISYTISKVFHSTNFSISDVHWNFSNIHVFDIFYSLVYS